MHKCSLVVIGLTLFCPPSLRAADRDLDNKPPEQQKAELRKEAESEAQQLKAIGAEKLSDVLQFKIEGNDLTLTSKLPTTDGYARLNVAGLKGYSKVQVNAGGVSSFQLLHQDFPPDGVVVLTMVFSMQNHLQVSRDEERNDERRNIQLIQSDQSISDGSAPAAGAGPVEDKVKLYINVTKKLNDETVQDLKLSASSMMELRRKYPAEIARYIEPIFRDLHQESVLAQVDSRLAWQVFASQYQPEPKVESHVKQLAAKLDAENYGDRELASKELQKLGAPAALVLMRLPRGSMTDEQQTRVDALVAPFKPLADDEAKKLKSDKFFLMDCLYGEDVQIRGWALAELQKVLGRTVAINIDAPQAEREEAVAALRSSVLGVAPPATQPVSTRPASTLPAQ
jgi:hypothetical protein